MTDASLHSSLPPLVPVRGPKYVSYVKKRQAEKAHVACVPPTPIEIASAPVRPQNGKANVLKYIMSRNTKDSAYYQHISRSDIGHVPYDTADLSPSERTSGTTPTSYNRAHSVPHLVPCTKRSFSSEKKGSKKDASKSFPMPRRYTTEDISLPVSFKHICHVDKKGAENYRKSRQNGTGHRTTTATSRSFDGNLNHSTHKSATVHLQSLSGDKSPAVRLQPLSGDKSPAVRLQSLSGDRSPAVRLQPLSGDKSPAVRLQPLSGGGMEPARAVTRSKSTPKVYSFIWDEFDHGARHVPKKKPPRSPPTQLRYDKPKPPEFKRVLVKRATTGNTRSCEDMRSAFQSRPASSGYLSSPNASRSPNDFTSLNTSQSPYALRSPTAFPGLNTSKGPITLSGSSMGSFNAASSSGFSFKSAATAVPAAPRSRLTYTSTR